MTAKEAYESVDSNYDNVLKRLGSEAMYQKVAEQYDRLTAALKAID